MTPSCDYCSFFYIIRHFMISGLKGAGVKDLTQYLMDQACNIFSPHFIHQQAIGSKQIYNIDHTCFSMKGKTEQCLIFRWSKPT